MDVEVTAETIYRRTLHLSGQLYDEWKETLADESQSGYGGTLHKRTIHFPEEDLRVDLKVVKADPLPYLTAELFSGCGKHIVSSEPAESLAAGFTLEDPDGNKYNVQVQRAPSEGEKIFHRLASAEPHPLITGLKTSDPPTDSDTYGIVEIEGRPIYCAGSTVEYVYPGLCLWVDPDGTTESNGFIRYVHEQEDRVESYGEAPDFLSDSMKPALQERIEYMARRIPKGLEDVDVSKPKSIFDVAARPIRKGSEVPGTHTE